jgi:hypothetical protein
MAEPKPFTPVKLICGIITGDPPLYDRARGLLQDIHGPVDFESTFLEFDFTDYYEREMGAGLTRRFLSFERLIEPERLPAIKLATNGLEDMFRGAEPERPGAGSEAGSGTVPAGRGRRPVNLDPGYLTASALIMATTKDFSHRVPLASGIYAHLEFLFTKTGGVRTLDWTYPDMRRAPVHAFFLEVRKEYLQQLR